LRHFCIRYYRHPDVLNFGTADRAAHLPLGFDQLWFLAANRGGCAALFGAGSRPGCRLAAHLERRGSAVGCFRSLESRRLAQAGRAGRDTLVISLMTEKLAKEQSEKPCVPLRARRF